VQRGEVGAGEHERHRLLAAEVRLDRAHDLVARPQQLDLRRRLGREAAGRLVALVDGSRRRGRRRGGLRNARRRGRGDRDERDHHHAPDIGDRQPAHEVRCY
jgi:hypothetical protein